MVKIIRFGLLTTLVILLPGCTHHSPLKQLPEPAEEVQQGQQNRSPPELIEENPTVTKQQQEDDHPRSPGNEKGSGNSPGSTCLGDPIIHYVGESPLIPLQRNDTGNAEDAFVMVKGRNLSPNCATTSIHVQGMPSPVPLTDFSIQSMATMAENSETPQKVTTNISQNSDGFLIKLSGNYLAKLADKDELTVTVIAVQINGSSNGPNRALKRAFASGKFLVRDVAAYREENNNKRFPLSEISASPLSSKEARYLFGPLVADNFFVVRLSLRNSDSMQRIVTTGMVRATGMALVEPTFSDEDGKTSPSTAHRDSFTMPIIVSPSSLTQMYKILDDQTPHQGRSVFFRALTFIGSIASAAVVPFDGSEDLLKGITLFTGNVIPGLDKFWDDSWPRFRSNVVEFGMQDIVKVPQNSEYSQKFLFFSKNTIQAQIQDPKQFGAFSVPRQWRGKLENFSPDGNWYESGFPNNEQTLPQLPKVAVVSLFLNNLEIPYETTLNLTPSSIGLSIHLGALEINAKRVKQELDTAASGWTTNGEKKLFNVLEIEELESVQSALTPPESWANANESEQKEGLELINSARKTVDSLAPEFFKQTVDNLKGILGKIIESINSLQQVKAVGSGMTPHDLQEQYQALNDEFEKVVKRLIRLKQLATMVHEDAAAETDETSVIENIVDQLDASSPEEREKAIHQLQRYNESQEQ